MNDDVVRKAAMARLKIGESRRLELQTELAAEKARKLVDEIEHRIEVRESPELEKPKR